MTSLYRTQRAAGKEAKLDWKALVEYKTVARMMRNYGNDLTYGIMLHSLAYIGWRTPNNFGATGWTISTNC